MKIQRILPALIMLSGCTQPEGKKEWFDTVAKNDTTCLKGLDRAKKELSNGKLIYCDYYTRYKDELITLLNKYNINFKDRLPNDVIVPGQNPECYYDFLNEQVELKHGKKFIDSLVYAADSIFISKHLNEVYDYVTWDLPPVFPGDKNQTETSHPGLQAEFDNQVVYPPDYKYTPKNNSLALAQIYVDIDEHGKAKVTNYEIVFWNSVTKEKDYNKTMYPKLSKLFTSLIERTKWLPAKIKSFNVKSSNEILLSFK